MSSFCTKGSSQFHASQHAFSFSFFLLVIPIFARMQHSSLSQFAAQFACHASFLLVILIARMYVHSHIETLYARCILLVGDTCRSRVALVEAWNASIYIWLLQVHLHMVAAGAPDGLPLVARMAYDAPERGEYFFSALSAFGSRSCLANSGVSLSHPQLLLAVAAHLSFPHGSLVVSGHSIPSSELSHSRRPRSE